MKPDRNPINIIILVINSLGLILTVPAICGLFTVVQKDHVVPIYVINLFISDLIQMCAMIANVAVPKFLNGILSYLYILGVMARAAFMMCVALERYLVIAWPHWYQFKRSVTTSVLISLIVWLCPFVAFIMYIFTPGMYNVFTTFFLLPFPVLVFSLVGTLKSLSAAISVSSEEKRQIVGAVVLVLCSYMLLSVSVIIFFLFLRDNPALSLVFTICSSFSPLLDLVLYVFMGKGATDKLRALLCCCRKETQRPKQQVLTVSGDRTGTVSSM
ncbi:G-protein coupled receptor 4-like [Mastacembelus armatus]|uniref:G-protein coupled receptor 4-like n=1 Tax=Mastacembelus armatus TaxID=205130 RepID=UPI000E45A3FE|nr:G-protein coupled receptor 4-like [Mastacembelus armatus]